MFDFIVFVDCFLFFLMLDLFWDLLYFSVGKGINNIKFEFFVFDFFVNYCWNYFNYCIFMVIRGVYVNFRVGDVFNFIVKVENYVVCFFVYRVICVL